MTKNPDDLTQIDQHELSLIAIGDVIRIIGEHIIEQRIINQKFLIWIDTADPSEKSTALFDLKQTIYKSLLQKSEIKENEDE